MSQTRPIIAIILAAGRGTRMGAADCPKVCLPVAGMPAVARLVETCTRCGVETQALVVGAGADAVMQAVAGCPGRRLFCHQPEPRGTGSAAKAAAKALRAFNYDGDMLVIAGDKVIEEAALLRLLAAFHETDCGLAFVTGRAQDFPTSGRVARDTAGRVLGIVETTDIARAQLLRELRNAARERPVPAEEARRMAAARLPNAKKAARALGTLWEDLQANREIAADRLPDEDCLLRVGGARLTPEQASASGQANLSVYLFRAPLLYAALDRLTSDNAQREEYLTDTIGILTADDASVVTVPVNHPDEVMAFNTPEELAAIEHRLAGVTHIAPLPSGPQPSTLNTQYSLSWWLSAFERREREALGALARIYGTDSPHVEERRRRILALLQRYREEFGEVEVVLARAPGRINVMGRHVDHQGGHVNMAAIPHDIWIAVGPRADGQVLLRNLETARFPDRAFSLDDLLSGYAGDWRAFVDSAGVQAQAAAAKGDWAQYAKAIAARMQVHAGRPMAGMNVVAGGNIPVAAGLSSSSAIIVALGEAMTVLNGLDMPPERFVELCGEAEWYVGTRGGAGDHAAMKFARASCVVQMGFFPFHVTDMVPFPPGCRLMVCNSHQRAQKTAGARDVFNQRVACYHLSRELLKRAYPQHAPAIEHLRDVSAAHLGVSEADLYAMLKALPTTTCRKEVISLLPEAAPAYLATHVEAAGDYALRAVALFGLAECARSRAGAGMLRRGEVVVFGQMMSVSHDGDRVAQRDGGGRSQPFVPDVSDAALEALRAASEAGRPEAALMWQPGGYACSTPEIDRMADIAESVEGVFGAQIAGAGLGGCLTALVREDACARLEEEMARRYYEPAGLEPAMFACFPVSGSGVLRV